MLRENLNPISDVLFAYQLLPFSFDKNRLETKALACVIFATVVADESLAGEVRVLGLKHGVSNSQLDDAAQFAVNADAESIVTDSKVRAALLLAQAASPSPAEITTQVVEACRQSDLSAPAIVELITWLSVLQMLHRLSSYFVGENK